MLNISCIFMTRRCLMHLYHFYVVVFFDEFISIKIFTHKKSEVLSTIFFFFLTTMVQRKKEKNNDISN